MMIYLFKAYIADLRVQGFGDHRQVYLSRVVPVPGEAHSHGTNQGTTSWKALFKQVQALKPRERGNANKERGSYSIYPHCPWSGHPHPFSLQITVTWDLLSLGPHLAPSNPFSLLR